MKRLILRLSVLAVIVGVGALAIAQSLRKPAKQETAANAGPAENTDEPGQQPPKPIPISPDEPAAPATQDYAASDPYGMSRFSSSGSQYSSGSSYAQPPSQYSAANPAQAYGGDDERYAAPKPPAAVASISDTPLRPPVQTVSDTTPVSDIYGSSQPAARGNEFTAATGSSTTTSGGPATAAITDNYGDSPLPPLRPPAVSATPAATANEKNGGYASVDGGYAPPALPAALGGGTSRAQITGDAGANLRAATQAVSDLYGTAAQSLRSPATLDGNRIAASGNGYLGDAHALGGSKPSAKPGPTQLEGPQTPNVTIEKAAPSEIQVGKPATFEIRVRNTGQIDAEHVTVTDQVPAGTQFVDSTPQAARAADGSLLWQVGTLKPGEESLITLQLMPQSEGEIGSVAKVAFAAQASVRTICTKPQLVVEHTAPPKVLIGESVTFNIRISNPGTGAATGVMLEEDVPPGLAHPAGAELEYEIGTLAPGESRDLTLTLKADKAGLVENSLLVRGDANLIAEHRVQLEVIAPRLQVAVEGPRKRYLDRQATYNISVANPGTAPATNVDLVAFLPKGLTFVEANNQGQYDAQQHAVYWSLEQLPARETGTVQLTTVPVETGEQKVRIEGKADLDLAETFEQLVQVESLAELYFDVADSADPIEVGSETVYQVRVINQGSKTATNVQIGALLPAGLLPVDGEGPSRAVVQGQQVIFEPLSRLAPKAEVLFKIKARGMDAGDQRIQVQLASDEREKPVAKEEITRVYRDR